MNGNNFQSDENFSVQGSNHNSDSNDRNRSYEYVFSSGFTQNSTRPPKKNSSNAFFVLLVVILCAACSFVAGFGGAAYARQLSADSETTATEPINEAPAKDNLLSEQPENILNKTPSVTSPYGSAGEDVFSVSQVVQKVKDAVVEIDVVVTVGNTWYGQQNSTGSGSGVIISADGYILTCSHVINSATGITVTLNSGSRYEASLVGDDPSSDLAVIRIQPTAAEPLTYVEQGCSADLVVGEGVVAIGNPLGTLGGTVTDGIISATERNISTSDGTTMTLLQTNAAINSGNSGGGLFNLDGKLIGIVNAKYAAEGVEGLAFAIPIDLAYEVQLDLVKYGYVRGVVDAGLEVMDINFDNMSFYEQQNYQYNYGINATGVYVISSAYSTELQNKDRIISVNGVAVNTTAELKAELEKYQIGDTVIVKASRNKAAFTASLTLREYVPNGIT